MTAESTPSNPSIKSFTLAFLGYLISSFIVAIVWHLIAFADYYDRLEIYREDKLVPLGFLIMIIQGIIFAKWYPCQTAGKGTAGKGVLAEGLRFAAIAGTLSWTYTTLAVAAKFPMTSIPDYIFIETAFTVCQWLVAGPLIAWAYSRP